MSSRAGLVAAIDAEINRLTKRAADLRAEAAVADRELARCWSARSALTRERTPAHRARGATRPAGGVGEMSRAERLAQIVRLLADRGPLGSSAIAAAIGYAVPSVATLLRRQTEPVLVRRVATGGRFPVWELTEAGRDSAKGGAA